MITFEDGLIMTCRLPLFSALYMLLRASFKTLTLTIFAKGCCKIITQHLAMLSACSKKLNECSIPVDTVSSDHGKCIMPRD